MSIRENLLKVLEQISRAAIKAGRKPEEIKLVAVTKTIPPQTILQAIEAGVKIIGENKAQEARDKYQIIKDRVIWHFIGNIQRNKVKYIVQFASCVHSLCDFNVAHEFNSRLEKIDKKMDFLIEVNLSQEPSKYGLMENEVLNFLHQISYLKHINIRGLMTMPPFFEDPEFARPFFIKLRQLKDQLQKEGFHNITELSMGMSNDFQVAIEEGATLVRIGTAIFGPRSN